MLYWRSKNNLVTKKQSQELICARYPIAQKVPEDDIDQLQSLYNTLHIAVETLKGLEYKSELEATDNVRRRAKTTEFSPGSLGRTKDRNQYQGSVLVRFRHLVTYTRVR